jgi:hypothetical protein
MKQILTVVALLLIYTTAQAQIEQGDTEISFMGYYSTVVGEDVDPNGTGSFQLSYGKYITPHLLLGVAPTLSFTTGQDEDGDPAVETNWSGSVFFTYNFSTTSKLIPYITGQFYQSTFDIPENSDFTDFSFATFGIGFKNFFNEYASLNTQGLYGFSLSEDAEGGILLIMTGLSFIF